MERIKLSFQNIIAGDSKGEDVSSDIIQLFDSEDFETKVLCAQVIAELSKNDTDRQFYAKNEIVARLLKCLDVPLNKSNVELMKQTCRALGNICYENMIGRQCIINLNGVPKMISVLDKVINTGSKDDSGALCLLACKMLSNFMLGDDNVKPCLDSNISNYFRPLLSNIPSGVELIEWRRTVLNLFATVAKQEEDYVFSDEVNLLVVDVLKTSEDFETLEFCVDFLEAQAEHDHIKLLYAKAGVVNLLVSKIQERSEELLKSDDIDDNDDLRHLMSNACNIIVIVLTGDEAMSVLYDDGKGEVYRTLIHWCHSPDIDVLITAMLAIGNFARKDTNCIRMMEEGVFDILFDVLEKQTELSLATDNQDCDGRLQHAILSAVRNMVVPRHNKAIAVSKGRVVPALLAMLPKVSSPNIVFKVIAAIRMLVDGQESVAVQLVNSTEAMKAAVKWGTRTEHSGPLGEAPRLFAWTIKQLTKRSDLQKVIQVDDCVPCIVNMLAAPHTIMQNEAIVAISKLIVAAAPLESENDKSDSGGPQPQNNEMEDLIKILADVDIGQYVNNLLESNSARSEVEMLHNIVTFVQLVVKQDRLVRHLATARTSDFIRKFIQNRKDLSEQVLRAFTDIVNMIDSVKSD